MGKIKLNLVSGAVVEKPLINAFKANNNSYVVLDNEINGSMGLPIILVCKFENNKLTKILDQNEWSIVKEYLKNIIAGNKIEFIKINNELVADDIYYTQLTLPVPSYDALKNAYKIEESIDIASMLDINPEPVVSTTDSVSSIAVDPIASAISPVVDNTQIPEIETPIVDSVPINFSVSPEIVQPSVDANISPVDSVVTPVSPINIDAPINPIVEEQPIVTDSMVDSVVEPVSPITNSNTESISSSIDGVSEISIFKDQKEAFMQACENMFDALVQKFEKELENRK